MNPTFEKNTPRLVSILDEIPSLSKIPKFLRDSTRLTTFLTCIHVGLLVLKVGLVGPLHSLPGGLDLLLLLLLLSDELLLLLLLQHLPLSGHHHHLTLTIPHIARHRLRVRLLPMLLLGLLGLLGLRLRLFQVRRVDHQDGLHLAVLAQRDLRHVGQVVLDAAVHEEQFGDIRFCPVGPRRRRRPHLRGAVRRRVLLVLSTCWYCWYLVLLLLRLSRKKRLPTVGKFKLSLLLLKVLRSRLHHGREGQHVRGRRGGLLRLHVVEAMLLLRGGGRVAEVPLRGDAVPVPGRGRLVVVGHGGGGKVGDYHRIHSLFFSHFLFKCLSFLLFRKNNKFRSLCSVRRSFRVDGRLRTEVEGGAKRRFPPFAGISPTPRAAAEEFPGARNAAWAGRAGGRVRPSVCVWAGA